MAETTLALSAMFQIAAAAIYGYVAFRLAPRRVASQVDFALAIFATWWGSLAASTVVSAFISILAGAEELTLLILVLLTHLNLLIICVALWALVYYLLYVFTGSPRVLVPLTILYIVFYLALVYFITTAQPNGYAIERWRVVVQYERPIEDNTFAFVALVVAILVPQMVGSLAFFTLFFKTKDPMQRYRIAIVSWSIFLWFASALLAAAAGLSQADWWQLTSRFIGLAAALLILMAYRPPAWIRRRLEAQPARAQPA